MRNTIKLLIPGGGGGGVDYLDTLGAFRFSSRGLLYQTTDTSTPAVADDAPIGRINEKSGSGHDPIQATASAKPTLKLNIINGLPVIRCDGGDSLVFGAGSLNLFRNVASALVIGLVRPTSHATNNRYWFNASQGTNATLTRAGCGVMTTAAFWSVSRRLDADSTITPNGGTVDDTSWYVQTGVFDYTAGSVQTRINGSQVATANFGSGGGNTSDTASLAMRLFAQAGGAEFFIGDVLEILIWIPKPADAVRNAVEAYLATLVS